MSKVIAYRNTERHCFCQIRFDSKERVLVSIANVPEPGIKVIKLLAGIFPYKTIWEFSLPGEKDAFDKMIAMLTDHTSTGVKHPLDAMIKKLVRCRSCNQAAEVLLEAEEKASSSNFTDKSLSGGL